MDLRIKRIYDPYSADDGFRILIDRLWPRGIKKEEARIDLWLKEAAPSAALRKWFNHEPEKWEQFRMKYHGELKDSAAVEQLLSALKKNKTVTLLFGARDQKHNHALVLKQFLEDQF